MTNARMLHESSVTAGIKRVPLKMENTAGSSIL